MNKPKRKNAAPALTVSPPLQTLIDVSTKANVPPINYALTAKHGGDKLGHLTKFMNQALPAGLSARAFGNVDDLYDIQENASKACTMLHTMCIDVEKHLNAKGQSTPERTEVAANLVIMGAAMVTSAYVLHLRPVTWTQGPALNVLRSGIESIARGGWVAFGTKDEPARMKAGGKHRPLVNDCVTAIDPHYKNEPAKVNAWLCNYTHLDYNMVLKGPPPDEHVYAAAAYVAWLGAELAGRIVGEPLATPPRLPISLPW